MKYIVFLTSFAFIYGCSYYPSSPGPVQPTPLGEIMKCVSKETHHLPTCYCNEHVVKAYPERERICAAAKSSFLKKIGDETTSKGEWLSDLRLQTAALEKHRPDEVELWSNNTLDYLLGNEITDDCDGLDSILDVLFLLGNFRLEELAKVLIQVSGNDFETKKYHYTAAVWIAGDWLVMDQSSTLPVYLVDMIDSEPGQYTVLAHRRLSEKNWRGGLPPMINTASDYL